MEFDPLALSIDPEAAIDPDAIDVATTDPDAAADLETVDAAAGDLAAAELVPLMKAKINAMAKKVENLILNIYIINSLNF